MTNDRPPLVARPETVAKAIEATQREGYIAPGTREGRSSGNATTPEAFHDHRRARLVALHSVMKTGEVYTGKISARAAHKIDQGERTHDEN